MTRLFITDHLKNLNDLAQISMFFIISTSLIAYLTADLSDSSTMILLSLWIHLLLAHSLALPKLFEREQHSGFMDQLRIAPVSMEGVIAAKWLSHWIALLVPLLLVTAGLGVILPIIPHLWPDTLLALALSSLGLLAIGGLSSALVLGQRQRAPLLLIIMLPLYVPIVIFGLLALDADPMRANSAWMCLVGLVALLLPIALLATARLLRYS